MDRGEIEHYALVTYDETSRGKTTTGQVYDDTGRLVTVYKLPTSICINSLQGRAVKFRRDRSGRLVYAR